MAEGDRYKRASAVPRKIAEINPEKDIRVSILGRIIEKSNGVLVVDEGSGTAEVITEEPSAEINDIVRIFCRVLPLENGFELRAEIIQVMNSLNMDFYKKVY